MNDPKTKPTASGMYMRDWSSCEYVSTIDAIEHVDYFDAQEGIWYFWATHQWWLPSCDDIALPWRELTKAEKKAHAHRLVRMA